MNWNWKHLGVILLVILIIYYIATLNTSNYENYLYGLWVADADFCDSAGIESLMMFFGEPECSVTGSKTRLGYMVLAESEGDAEELVTQGFFMDYRSGWASPWLSNYCIGVKLDFDEEQVMPESVNMSLDMRRGEMKIYGYDEEGEMKLYARMYKQHS